MDKKLGRGLGALIPERTEAHERTSSIAIAKISPNRFQPRKKFDEEKLKELMDSIREKGVIQPVIVRPDGDSYELIAGERRFRAVKELGYENIPAIIKDVSDADSLELSLIENIQREELNPIEEARAYKELTDKFNFSQAEISKAVGKDNTTVSNTLRLLSLPPLIQKYIEDNVFSMGHAKAILSLATEREKIRFAKKIIRKSLSVRQIEELVKARLTRSGARKTRAERDSDLASMEEKLQHYLGTRVRIMHGKKRGRIEIQYFSNEDLERLINLILDKNR
jgi:ParB family chromosome partitioning protein